MAAAGDRRELFAATCLDHAVTLSGQEQDISLIIQQIL